MTSSRLRLVVPVFSVACAALLVTGCTTSPGATAPTSTADEPTGTTPPDGDVGANEFEAAWLDDGRAIAVVTWGSSTCVPVVDTVSAKEQTIEVVLAGNGEKACTDDLVARAEFVGVPEGVDVTADVDLTVTYGARTENLELDALDDAPQGMTEYTPSAGWFDDDGIVLLTWGSSSCPPIVDDVEQTDAGATVTFQATDRVCTMDMAPRLTPILLPRDHDGEAFELTLVGENLDTKLSVLG